MFIVYHGLWKIADKTTHRTNKTDNENWCEKV